MDDLYLAYTAVGLAVLLFAFSSGLIKRYLWSSELMLAVFIGILIGPIGLNLLALGDWGNSDRLVEELARLTVAISVMGIALRLPHQWLRQRWRALAVILLLAMPLMWLVSALSARWILDLPWLQALLLGAIIVPTDPVVSSTIVSGQIAEDCVDEDTRNLISAEAGMNDGLAFLLVMIPVLLVDQRPAAALGEWLTQILLLEVLVSIAAGALAGALLGAGLRRTRQLRYARQRSLFATSIALVLALLGGAELLGGDGLLAVFAAGLAFNWKTGANIGEQASREDDHLKTFFDVPLFIAFGILLPWDEWLEMYRVLVPFALAVLFLRRLPVILLLQKLFHIFPDWRRALFVGWFGPIAVAAMVYGAWVDLHRGLDQLWTVASFVVFCSILVHGFSATPLSFLLAAADQKAQGRARDRA